MYPKYIIKPESILVQYYWLNHRPSAECYVYVLIVKLVASVSHLCDVTQRWDLPPPVCFLQANNCKCWVPETFAGESQDESPICCGPHHSIVTYSLVTLTSLLACLVPVGTGVGNTYNSNFRSLVASWGWELTPLWIVLALRTGHHRGQLPKEGTPFVEWRTFCVYPTDVLGSEAALCS